MAGGVFFPNGKNTPPDPLETTKERAAALPLETFLGVMGELWGTGDEIGRGRAAGVVGPYGRRGWGWPGSSGAGDRVVEGPAEDGGRGSMALISWEKKAETFA